MIKRYKSSFSGVTIDPSQLTFVVGNLISEMGMPTFTTYEGEVSNVEISNVVFGENPISGNNAYSFDYFFEAEESSTYAVKSTQGMPSNFISGAFSAEEIFSLMYQTYDDQSDGAFLTEPSNVVINIDPSTRNWSVWGNTTPEGNEFANFVEIGNIGTLSSIDNGDGTWQIIYKFAYDYPSNYSSFQVRSSGGSQEEANFSLPVTSAHVDYTATTDVSYEGEVFPELTWILTISYGGMTLDSPITGRMNAVLTSPGNWSLVFNYSAPSSLQIGDNFFTAYAFYETENQVTIATNIVPTLFIETTTTTTTEEPTTTTTTIQTTVLVNGKISGYVYDNNGNPIQNAYVIVKEGYSGWVIGNYYDENESSWKINKVLTDADGYYEYTPEMINSFYNNVVIPELVRSLGISPSDVVTNPIATYLDGTTQIYSNDLTVFLMPYIQNPNTTSIDWEGTMIYNNNDTLENSFQYALNNRNEFSYITINSIDDSSVNVNVSFTTTTTTTEAQNIWDAVTQDGLVLHFDINSPDCYDGSSTLSDLSKGGNTGNIVNASFDPEGSSLFFNSNGYVATTYQIPIMDENNDFTWDIWLNVLDRTSGAGVLIGKRYFAEQLGDLKFIKLTQNDLQYYANNSSSSSIGNNITANSWVNVCVVKSGSYLKYYFNNSIVGTTGIIASDIQIPFYIGGDPINGEYTRSKISVVRVYDRELSESEISQNYNITLPRYQSIETTTTTTTEEQTTTTTTTEEQTTTTTTTENPISEYTLTFKTLEYGDFKPTGEPLSVELFEENFAYLKDFINYLENEVNLSQKSLDELEKTKNDLESRVTKLEGGGTTTTTTTTYPGLKVYSFQSLKEQNSSIVNSLTNTGDWNGKLEIVLSSFTYDGPVYYIKKDGTLGNFKESGTIMLNDQLTYYLEINYYPISGLSTQGDLEGNPSWDFISIYEEPTTTTTTTEQQIPGQITNFTAVKSTALVGNFTSVSGSSDGSGTGALFDINLYEPTSAGDESGNSDPGVIVTLVNPGSGYSVGEIITIYSANLVDSGKLNVAVTLTITSVNIELN